MSSTAARSARLTRWIVQLSVAALLGGLQPHHADAQDTFTWTGDLSTTWDRQDTIFPFGFNSNWSPNFVPDPSDNVRFVGTPVRSSVNLGGNRSVNTAVFDGLTPSIFSIFGGELRANSVDILNSSTAHTIASGARLRSNDTKITSAALFVPSGAVFDARGDVDLLFGDLNINDGGQFQLAAGSAVNVGLGSTLLFTTDDAPTFNGAIIRVQGGGLLRANDGFKLASSNVDVNGSGSSFRTNLSGSANQPTKIAFGPFDTSVMTVRNGASADFGNGDLWIGTNENTGVNNLLNGTLNIESGADAVISGDIRIGGFNRSTGRINLDGFGSTLTMNGNARLDAGGDVDGFAEINVRGGATFTSGTGPLFFNEDSFANVEGGSVFFANGELTLADAQVRVGGGTLFANQDINLIAGRLIQETGSFVLAPNRTVEASDGSLIDFQASYDLDEGTTFDIRDGSDFNVAGTLDIGRASNGTLIVQGPSTQLNTNTASGAKFFWGGSGSTADITFRDQAQATIGSNAALYLADSSVIATTANVRVESGADFFANSIRVGPNNGTATLTVTGSGSSLVQTAGSELRVGSSSPIGSGFLTVDTQAAVTTGSGGLDVYNSGDVAVRSSGHLTSSGELTVRGDGSLTVDTQGTVTADGGGLTVSNTGGVVVQSSGTLNSSGQLTLQDSGSLTVASDGAVFTDGLTVTATATATVDDAKITAGSVLVGTDGGGGGSDATLTLNPLATVNASALTRVATNGSLEVTGGELNASGGMTVQGTFRQSDSRSTTRVVGQTTIDAGGSLDLQSGNFVANGGLDATAGTLDLGNATLTVLQGAFEPAASPFVIANFTLAASVQASLEFGDAATAVFEDRLTIGGNQTSPGSFGLQLTDRGRVLLEPGSLMSVAGQTTVETFGTLVIDGGTFKANGGLNGQGDIDHRRGTLAIAGGAFEPGLGAYTVAGVGSANAATLRIDQGGSVAFADNLTVGGSGTSNDGSGTLFLQVGSQVDVAGTTTIGDRGAIDLVGGTLAFGTMSLADFGQINGASGTLRGSVALPQTLTDMASLPGPGNLGNLSPSVDTDAVALLNQGLLLGEGTTSFALANASTGQVEVITGERMRFQGSGSTNAGGVDVFGGQVRFDQELVNQAGGLITNAGGQLLVGNSLTNEAGGRLDAFGGIFRADTIVNDNGGTIAGRGIFIAESGFTNHGAMTLSGGATDIRGDAILGAASQVTTGGGVTTFFDDLHFEAGALVTTTEGSQTVAFGEVTGSINTDGDGLWIVTNGGTLSPGNSPGLGVFGGDLKLESGASLLIELAGGDRGTQYDAIDVAGLLELGGTLEVALLEGFAPQAGDTFEILTASAATGAFADVVMPTLPGGGALEVVYQDAGVLLQFVGGLLAGDFNGNGAVEQGDLNLVLNNWGASRGAWSNADGLVTANVDQEELNAVLNHWGASSAPDFRGSAVPEPGVAAVALLGLAAWRRRRSA